VPTPLEGEVDRIVLWTQVMTGMELDDNGVVRVLDAETWQDRRQRLEKRGGPPAASEEAFAREQREAADCEQQRQWFAAVFHLNRLIDKEPGDGLLCARRGRAHFELGAWNKAGTDHAKALELGVNTEAVWFLHTWLRWALGDLDGYRKSCMGMFERFGKAENPVVVNNLAWACVLAPDAGVKRTVLVRLAERAVKAAPKNWVYLNTLGAAHYRAGQWDTAIQRLNEGVQAHGKGGTASDWLFLAMAHQRLGHNDKAKKWLDKAVKWIDHTTQKRLAEAAKLPLFQNLELQILRREAEALVHGKAAGSKK
jgi:tetratricopeptide (TPR) repeat protein